MRVSTCSTWLRPVADLFALALAVLVTLRWPGDPVSLPRGAILWLFPAFVVAPIYAHGHYRRKLTPLTLRAFMPVLGAISTATMALIVLETFSGRLVHRHDAYLELWAAAVVTVGAGRVAIITIEQFAFRQELGGRRTLIVGAGVVGSKIARRLHDRPGYGLRPVGFLDSNPLGDDDGRELVVLGGPDDLESVAELTGAEHVVVAFSSIADSEMIRLIRSCEQLGLSVSLVPRLWESLNHRATYETLGGMPLLELAFTDPKGWQFSVKHGFDRVVAGVLLVLLAPLIAVLAVAVRCSSRGPILLRQRRVGCDGRQFEMLKFRTMTPAGDRPEFEPGNGSAPGGVEGEDRRTRAGRLLRATSVDELPQLINVLRGEMSLVGPRPERPEYVHRFAGEIDGYGRRHRVRSGMTGWAQIHGLRGQTSLQDRIEWDNYYIEHWSPGLDLRIIVLTPFAMFRSGE